MKIVIILLAIIMVVMLGLAYLKGLYSPGHKDHDWSQMEVTNTTGSSWGFAIENESIILAMIYLKISQLTVT